MANEIEGLNFFKEVESSQLASQADSVDFNVTNVVHLNDVVKKAGEQGLSVQHVEIWAIVSANDNIGLILDDVKKGDVIAISASSGYASYKQSNMALLRGLITIGAAVAKTGIDIYSDGTLKPVTDAFQKGANNIISESNGKVKHARRDSWGQDPGTGDYGKDEGGLIVCMPRAYGAIYATSDNYVAGPSKQEGRKEQYYNGKVRDTGSFLPCPVSGGVMSREADQDGTVNILAFDNQFADNAGYYQFKVSVTRNN